ncbi:MAG: tripartite tricarboxylate transporter substrate binding protein [Pseudomonadota bacterium]|nr:tripartite tricarboxylate transporter substrate binding protein [Pseudomonadota bacterium]
MINAKIFACIGAALTLSASTATVAQTAEFPTKPMTYIIPFAAGGESDISARFQQSFWKEVAGQPVIIQYQPGAGGAQAWSQLNTIEGDGYTIMGINLPHTVLQPMEGAVGYKTDDLTPVHYFHYTPDAIFVSKDSKFETLEQLVEYAKKNPGLVTFAGSGSNSSNHLAQATFSKLAGIITTYIPFSGTGPAMTAVLGNQTQAGFVYVTSGLGKGDELRILAVAAEKRLPAFPDVPTFRELGYDLVSGAYRGVAVPNSTPEELRQRISDIVQQINENPEFIKKMEDNGFVLTNVTYDQMDALLEQKKAEYAEAAKLLGIGK